MQYPLIMRQKGFEGWLQSEEITTFTATGSQTIFANGTRIIEFEKHLQLRTPGYWAGYDIRVQVPESALVFNEKRARLLLRTETEIQVYTKKRAEYRWAR